MKPEYTIILFYNYISIENPERFCKDQKILAQKLNLTGRVIIASEGINATFEGKTADIEVYVKSLLSLPGFENVHIKRSEGVGNAFPKLSIKVRSEIVSTHLSEDENVNPTLVTGKYITAEELHSWLHPTKGESKEFYIIDMRNDYEQEVGHFEGSVFSGMKNFYDIKDTLKQVSHLKDKTVVTVCTGGIRCEKASGFLVKHGFSDVYQLYGGIVTYMEKYPGEDFLGALYVFDNRLVMGFNMDDPKRKIIGKCAKCLAPSENFINCSDNFCHRHFIVCKDCLEGKESMLCPMGCLDYSQDVPYLRWRESQEKKQTLSL